MPRLLIRNARIARPDGTTFDGDILCENGRIARLGPALDERADETLDAQGHLHNFAAKAQRTQSL